MIAKKNLFSHKTEPKRSRAALQRMLQRVIDTRQHYLENADNLRDAASKTDSKVHAGLLVETAHVADIRAAELERIRQWIEEEINQSAASLTDEAQINSFSIQLRTRRGLNATERYLLTTRLVHHFVFNRAVLLSGDALEQITVSDDKDPNLHAHWAQEDEQ